MISVHWTLIHKLRCIKTLGGWEVRKKLHMCCVAWENLLACGSKSRRKGPGGAPGGVCGTGPVSHRSAGAPRARCLLCRCTFRAAIVPTPPMFIYYLGTPRMNIVIFQTSAVLLVDCDPYCACKIVNDPRIVSEGYFGDAADPIPLRSPGLSIDY